jgi:hypothetical protein
MAESKSAALPLGYIPKRIHDFNIALAKPGSYRGLSHCATGLRPASTPRCKSLSFMGILARHLNRNDDPGFSLPGAIGPAIEAARSKADPPSQIRALVCGTTHQKVGRSVAQPGSALASGARGRRFKSSRSDQILPNTLKGTILPLAQAREVDVATLYQVSNTHPHAQSNFISMISSWALPLPKL